MGKNVEPETDHSKSSCRASRLLCLLPLLLFLFTAAVLPAFGNPETAQRHSSDPDSLITLPAPKRKGNVSLEEALNQREAIRSYAAQPLSLQDLSQLLWAGGGVQVDAVSGPTRTAPSAGALYPQELFVFAGKIASPSGSIEPGVYRYEPRNHQLVQLSTTDTRRELARAALQQSFIADAPAVIVIASVVERTAAKYGKRSAERYIFLDAGHSAQNISLQATALDLASALVGAFSDDAVAALLPDTEATPIYIIPVGHP